ncbi:anaerobic ribonucleoside-triphosphate reductase activating protein [[Clostridium] cellulosi]
MSELNISGIIRESIVDGPGIRFVVFAQGCPHHCRDCHNPQTWPFSGGKKVTPERIMAEIKKDPLLTGVTLSGGEPFCQPKAMAEIARLTHEAGLDVVTFTGYLFEHLVEKAKEDDAVRDLLNETDVLVDGPFIASLKSYDLKFRGSSNQRAIDVKKSLDEGKVITVWE